MASDNPYQASAVEVPSTPMDVRKVDIKVFELLKRGYEMIKDQYGLFFGISLGGIILGSVVPMGILLGPMMVGIYICLRHKRQGIPVEFGTLFKGFDQFGEALIAWIILIAFSMVLVIPMVMIIFGAMFGILIATQGNEEAAGVSMMAMMLVLYPVMFAVSTAIYIPFLFTFAIMAREKGISGVDAVKKSWAGSKANFWGVAKFVFGSSALSIVLALMCYVPALLFMPVVFAAIHVLFESIYGAEPETEAIPSSMTV